MYIKEDRRVTINLGIMKGELYDIEIQKRTEVYQTERKKIF